MQPFSLLPLTCWPVTVDGLAYRERGERGRGHTGVPPLLTQGNWQAVQQVEDLKLGDGLNQQILFKGTVSPDRYFLNQYYLCILWWFSRSFKSSSLSFTIINLLFASLKLLTNFENAYWNPPQNSLLCDWLMFSSADLSVAAGKMCKNYLVTGGFRYEFIAPQAASCKQKSPL